VVDQAVRRCWPVITTTPVNSPNRVPNGRRRSGWSTITPDTPSLDRSYSFPRRLASPGSVEHQLDERSQPETSVVPAGFGTSWCSNLPGVLHYGGDWIHICWSTSISIQN